MRITLHLTLVGAMGLQQVAHAQPGTLDPSFGSNGVVAFDANEPRYLSDLLVQPDGRIVLVGSIESDPGTDEPMALIMRRMPDGTADPSFSFDGMATINPQVWSHAISATLLVDGRIAVQCEVADDGWTMYPTVIMYNADGSLHTGFNGNGIRTLPGSSYFRGHRILTTASGNLLVIGSEHDTLCVWQLAPNGSLDPTFSFDGVVRITVPGLSSRTRFFLDPEGDLLVCGEFETDDDRGLFAARLLPSGNLDPTFGENGISWNTIGEDHDRFVGAFPFSDGRTQMVLLAGVEEEGLNRLLMLLPDGSPDQSFGPSGIRSAPAEPTTQLVSALLQPDGGILLSGMRFLLIGSEEIIHPCITRVDQFLVPDPSFGTDGTAIADISSFDVVEIPHFHPLELQADGRILAASTFGIASGSQVIVARYLNDVGAAVVDIPGTSNDLSFRYDEFSDALLLSAPQQDHVTRLRLFDARGALLYDRTVSSRTHSPLEVRLAGLANGLHIIMIDRDSGPQSRSFIINHH